MEIINIHSKYRIVEEALYGSVMCNNYDFVEYLIKYVKDINFLHLNHFGTKKRTILYYAKKSDFRCDDIIELLESNGAHI